jgi:hypothetical protein
MNFNPNRFIYIIFKFLFPAIENRDIELDSFDKNPQRKDRTNSGGALLIYSKEDIGTYQSICYYLKT